MAVTTKFGLATEKIYVPAHEDKVQIKIITCENSLSIPASGDRVQQTYPAPSDQEIIFESGTYAIVLYSVDKFTFKIQEINNFDDVCGTVVFSLVKTSAIGTMVNYVTDQASTHKQLDLHANLAAENDLTLKIVAQNIFHELEIVQKTIIWRSCEAKSASYLNANF